jgi:S1-C subfamily serine protease
MSRKSWVIVAGVCCALIVLLAVLAFVFRDSWAYKMLVGPIAAVEGDQPKHGFLGVGFGGGTASPLTIQSVVEGSGAADAGLQVGDVILAASGADKPDLPALQRVLQASAPGEKLLLRISRGPDEIEVRVRLISFTDMMVLDERARSGRTGP